MNNLQTVRLKRKRNNTVVTPEASVTDNTIPMRPLPIHELLDRFEILYPNISELSDLRRAVIDKDLNSIFRLVDHSEDFRKAVVEENLHSIFRIMDTYTVKGNSDDLRRAVVENNLYSLFRLYPEDDDHVNLLRTSIVNKNLRSIFKILGDNDLRKVILDENYWKLWPLIEQYVNTQFIAAFKTFFINDTKIDTDCFSRGQLQSKIWLVNELKKLKITDLGTVFLCAGWYGILSVLLFENEFNIKRMISFDIDPTCASIAETFNKPWVKDDWKFKASTTDIMTMTSHDFRFNVYRSNGTVCELTQTPDTIINTSCEHILKFSEWYSKIAAGKLLILQANDFNDLDMHTNCYNSVEDFAAHTPMKQVLYSGVLKLEKYNRFMRIGIK